MTPKVIKTEADYVAALARIDAVMDAKPGTPAGDELELLVALVELYEQKAHPVDLPDPVSAIRFRMEQQGLKQKDLVAFIGSKSKVSELLSGKRLLSLKMIRALHRGLGIPAEVLLREPGASIPAQTEAIEWDRFPLREMIRRKWIPGYKGTLAQAREHAEELVGRFLAPLSAVGVHPALCRQHVRAGGTMDPHALLAWRARVLIVSLGEEVGEYRPGSVTREFMQELGHLSYLQAGPILGKEFLSKAGIHLVVERHLPQTHLDGAAMMLPSGNPVIGLTLRYDRLDNFWFTLCHELGHVALHLGDSTEDCYVDDTRATGGSKPEREADRFARDCLIPPESWQTASVRRGKAPINEILSFARDLRIHPAIVAGRIRRERRNYRILARAVGQGQVRKLFVAPDSLAG